MQRRPADERGKDDYFPVGETPAQESGIVAPDAKLPEWLAVLCVAGIAYHLTRDQSDWLIHVEPGAEDTARRLIEVHEVQHCDWPPQPASAPVTPGKWAKSLWAGFWGVYLVALFYLWQGPYRATNALLRAGGAQRSAIRAGEWWRTITALMIHADAGHLVSNMLFLFGFAALVCHLYGRGRGWLMIVLAGGVGNGLVSLTATRDTVGVGASTACFAALGLLVAHGLTESLRRDDPWRQVWRRAWLPLMGGLAMLSITGAAPGTDIAAHLFGFLAGIAIGFPVAGLHRKQTAGRAQLISLCAVCILVAGSWLLAWFYGGGLAKLHYAPAMRTII